MFVSISCVYLPSTFIYFQDSTQTSESDSSGCSSVDAHNRNILQQNSPMSATTTNESAGEDEMVLNKRLMGGNIASPEDQDIEVDEEMQRISR